ncbi:uncharacterized protein LOC105699752 isoform X2 [Orussus abietinus]|uniref:uncharacterized protein LOC105699752 isoform X2 n=1 Tax=Orussus abietinus TaxID=222816 RepID=UPI000626B7CF|nr:uncharacterized protein LOC105699752 isoform X2 [Orussus abietinus]
MTEFDELVAALNPLHRNVTEFPIGAVSLEDFKPIDEKIEDERESLKRINSRSLMLRVKKDTYFFPDTSKLRIGETVDMLHENIVEALINKCAINLCLHSEAIHNIYLDKDKCIEPLMNKLFLLNDASIALQNSIKEVSERRILLKKECQDDIFQYHNFLKEEQNSRNNKFKETNPELAERKKKIENKLIKINIMKRLITNLISGSGNMITKKSLLEMLHKHRNLVTADTIFETF